MHLPRYVTDRRHAARVGGGGVRNGGPAQLSSEDLSSGENGIEAPCLPPGVLRCGLAAGTLCHGRGDCAALDGPLACLARPAPSAARASQEENLAELMAALDFETSDPAQYDNLDAFMKRLQTEQSALQMLNAKAVMDVEQVYVKLQEDLASVAMQLGDMENELRNYDRSMQSLRADVEAIQVCSWRCCGICLESQCVIGCCQIGALPVLGQTSDCVVVGSASSAFGRAVVVFVGYALRLRFLPVLGRASFFSDNNRQKRAMDGLNPTTVSNRRKTNVGSALSVSISCSVDCCRIWAVHRSSPPVIKSYTVGLRWGALCTGVLHSTGPQQRTGAPEGELRRAGEGAPRPVGGVGGGRDAPEGAAAARLRAGGRAPAGRGGRRRRGDDDGGAPARPPAHAHARGPGAAEQVLRHPRRLPRAVGRVPRVQVPGAGAGDDGAARPVLAQPRAGLAAPHGGARAPARPGAPDEGAAPVLCPSPAPPLLWCGGVG